MTDVSFRTRHDRDAGGPADVLTAKAVLREEVWSAMAPRRSPASRARRAEPEPFFALDPDHLEQPPRKAASISGASRSAPAGHARGLVAGGPGRDGLRRRRRGGLSRAEPDIEWNDLTEEKIAAIPLLRALRAAQG